MSMRRMPLCDCGHQLGVSVEYSGADWNCEAGDKSGYGWEVSLSCPACGRTYTVAHAKRFEDISWPLGVQKYEE